MSPEESSWIGLGGTTKLTANITTTSVDSIKIYWQRVENNSMARNIVLNTIKYSGSSCDVPVPELVINDVDTTDAGLYQIKVTTITGSFIGPRVAVEVIDGKLFLVLCRNIGPGPESQEGPCESLKSPIALTIDLVFSTIFSVHFFCTCI
jgi:hypothetical protein